MNMFLKKEVSNMWVCKFLNKRTNEEFSKTFFNEKDYALFMTKCRYSKKLKCIDKKIWA